MAETKIISVEAISSIQDLKNNIRELKKEIDTLKVGSDEYNDRVRSLTENQRALRLAMTGTYESMKQVADASRADTAALDATVEAAKKGISTYNQMSTALSALKNEIKSIPKYLSEQDAAIGNLNPKYQELQGQISVLDKSLKALDADNGVFTRNVGNYLGALSEWGGAMGQVRQIGNDLMAGIMGLVGVMSMFGADTEDTKDSLQALMPVLALLNAGKGIGGLAKILPVAALGQKALATSTAQSAAASTADAGAKAVQTTATEAATVAQEGLNNAMKANPAILIVSAILALGSAIAVFVRNSNKAAKETRDWNNQEKLLNETFKQQNDNLERENKVLAAQGVSQTTILVRKKELLKAQKAETEALLGNIKARLSQMKADSAWVRFWKGENKMIKNLEEEMKSLTEQMKGFDNSIANIDTDIQVEGINNAKNAAKKYVDTLKNDVKNAVSVANSAIESQRTELEQIKNEYTTAADTLSSGLTKAGELLKNAKTGTEEWKAIQKDITTITKGLAANQERYNKALAENESKEYLKTLSKNYKEIITDIDKATGKRVELEQLLDTVLGLSSATDILHRAMYVSDLTEESIADTAINASTAVNNLVSGYERLGGIIEEDIKKQAGFNGVLEDLTVSGLNWDALVYLSKTDAEKLAANVGEPLATAIGEWVKNSDSLRDAKFKMWTELTAVGESLIDEALQKNSPDTAWANLLVKTLQDKLKEQFGDNDELTAIVNEYIASLTKKVDTALFGDSWYLNFKEKYEAAMRLQMDSFTAVAKMSSDFLDNYVETTADALSSVSDLWEQSLKLRYKNLVESGKMTEEEAEAQAQESFKAVKALQMTVAGIDTAAAIMRALADATVPSFYVRAANAAAAGIAGIAQIAQISMTEFGKPSVNTASISTPSMTQAPNETVYTYGLNPADYAQAYAQTPVRAYVVDSDLSDGLAKYEQRNKEVTF